jgi:4-hydroxybenzoate polyprenyltransferase
MNIVGLIQAMRPTQWTKNAVVLAAFFFALGDKTQKTDAALLWLALAATALFSLLSSSVYLINDVRDREQDRLHPTKKMRPIAAGTLSPTFALTFACMLMGAVLITAFIWNTQVGLVLSTYAALQVAYTLGLKRIALVDVFVIAIGFVLRALCGAVAVDVEISPWLLLCTLLLALFLGLCKRRHEKVILDDVAGTTRESMKTYDGKLLDQLIAIVSAATIVCYALYTLWPDTLEKFGTANLGFTIPFVLFGIFRYLDLVYRHHQGDSPDKILLTDKPLLICMVLYGATAAAVILWP